MYLNQLPKMIELRLSQAYPLPKDDELVASLIWESYMYIGMNCEPVALLERGEQKRDRLLRELDDGFFLVMPDYPDLQSEDAVLQLDEILGFALINHICFLISGELKFVAIRDEYINNHKNSMHFRNYELRGD